LGFSHPDKWSYGTLVLGAILKPFGQGIALMERNGPEVASGTQFLWGHSRREGIVVVVVVVVVVVFVIFFLTG